MGALVFSLPSRLVKARTGLGLIAVLSSLPTPLAAIWFFGLPPWPGEYFPLLGLTLLAHFGAFGFTDRMVRYPGREVWGVAAFNIMLFTLGLIAVLALGRIPYSGSFLTASTSLALVFLLLYLRFAPYARLALVPGGQASRLKGLVETNGGVVTDWADVEGLVADLRNPSPEVYSLLREALLRGLSVWHVATVYEQYTGRVLLEDSPGYPNPEGIGALAEADRGPYMLFKRIWETALILSLAPLILLLGSVVALLVYLDLGRPVIFAQERVGMGGRPFKAYKFRTMRGLPRQGVYAGNEVDRITPLGRFLRRYRLDELPQLWNVITGDMSLVGPRPEQKVLAEKYSQEMPLYPLRHVVRPGLTGWAQVHHGYAEGWEGAWEKLSYDLYYIKHFSFWLDLRILVRTLWVVFTGFGAK